MFINLKSVAVMFEKPINQCLLRSILTKDMNKLKRFNALSL